MKNSELYRKQFNKIIKVLPEFKNYTVTLSLEDNVYHCTSLVNVYNCTKMRSEKAVLVKNVKLKDSFDLICANCFRSIMLTDDLNSPMQKVFDKLINLINFEEKINALKATDENYLEKIKPLVSSKQTDINPILNSTLSKKVTFFLLDFIQVYTLKLEEKFNLLLKERAVYVQTVKYQEELFKTLAETLLPIPKVVVKNSILKKNLEPVIVKERENLIKNSGWCLLKVSSYNLMSRHSPLNEIAMMKEILELYKISTSFHSYFVVYHMPQILLDYLELKGLVASETPIRFVKKLSNETTENIQGLITEQGPNSELKHVLRVAKTV